MIDRVALFVTCLADTLFPGCREGNRDGARATRGRGRVSARADVLRPDARELGVSRRGGVARSPFRRDLRLRFDAVVTPSGSCAAQVREHMPGLLGGRRRWRAGANLGAFAVPHRRPRASRTSTRATRARSPITRRAIRCGSFVSATHRCGCFARSPGSSFVELPDAEECCGFGGTFAVKNAGRLDCDARREAGGDRCVGSGERLRVRQLVPDAHRRRPSPPRARRAAGAPGRDPGLVSGAARDARPESLPARGDRRARQSTDARQHPARHEHDPRQAGCRRGRGARLGGTASSCRSDQGSRRSPASTRCSSSWRPPSRRPGARCTGRATRPRRTRSWSASSGPRVPRRSSR